MTTDSLRAKLDELTDDPAVILNHGELAMRYTLIRELLADHPLSGGGVGSLGALPLGTEHGEETPTPPPLTVDREWIAAEIYRALNACLCNADVPGWTMAEEAHKAADVVVAELAAGRTVIDLNEAKAEALRAEAQWFRDGAQSPTAGPSGRIVAMAMADEIDKHADALDGGGTD